jgi:hypothetical protein
MERIIQRTAILFLVVAILAAPDRRAEAFSQSTAGYLCRDSEEPGGPAFAWDDISTTGTLVAFSSTDNAVVFVTFPSGFVFNHFGTNFTIGAIGTNGLLQLGSTATTSGINTTLPGTAFPNNTVAPFWDDLIIFSGQVRWQLIGVAPNRRFVVSWINVQHVGFTTTTFYTFQLALFETTGAIRFQYQTMTGPFNNGNSATVGIENGNGTLANQYSFGTATLSTDTTPPTPSTNDLYGGLAIEFVPTSLGALVQSDEPAGTSAPAGFVDTDPDMSFRTSITGSAATSQLQVEVKPLATPFNAATGMYLGNAVPSGSSSEVTVTGLLPGDYHWRARAVPSTGQPGPWVEFDPAAGADFTIVALPSGGGGATSDDDNDDSRAREIRREVCNSGAGALTGPAWVVLWAAFAAIVLARRRRS